MWLYVSHCMSRNHTAERLSAYCASLLLCRQAKDKPLAGYETDMGRLASLTEDVLAENVRENVKFLSVNCTPLKQVSW